MESVSHQRIHGTTRRLSLWTRRKVGSNCHLVFDSNYYSVPYAYYGKEVTLQVTEKLVKIYERINPLSHEEGKLGATHPRLRSQGKFQTNPSHYPSWKIVSRTEYQDFLVIDLAIARGVIMPDNMDISA